MSRIRISLINSLFLIINFFLRKELVGIGIRQDQKHEYISQINLLLYRSLIGYMRSGTEPSIPWKTKSVLIPSILNLKKANYVR